ncbi:MAG: RNA pseudouridine synthase [Gammaproteobacteria bacterium]|jgi:tRNA pseudouridine32 synthase / 23S rRNA pseudouridine746 synthase|nr:RNA pseudouridine synthase [Gammaproteobacteria bacterium]MBU2224798.1 RNA pseudouridine synthase [Gammaproteobacteria bacterium]MBU2278852.1 RNA pseudouridine synthase [Gammaproteobacteria bacterium]MBU2428574.1 RNA pseudouridine synthase [Gammaproteobacteria bacterium]
MTRSADTLDFATVPTAGAAVLSSDEANNWSGFKLVAEHPDFVVLDKAPGVSFHSEDGAGLVVLAAAGLGYPLYAVHRLDKVTSGLILFARSSAAAAALSALFASQQIQKYYLALSLGKVAKKQGWVKGDMAPARRGAYKLLASMQNPAVSYFMSHGFNENSELPARCRLFLIKPFTGKTHQIRVALKSVSAVIVGDELYQADAADRVYLHAYALSFSLNGQIYQYLQLPTAGDLFQADVVQQHLQGQWHEPWSLPWPTL